MFDGLFSIPKPDNETVLAYGPGSPERESLQAKLIEMQKNPVEVPAIIGGKEIRTGQTVALKCPHKLSQELGVYHKVSTKESEMAIDTAKEAWKEWSILPWRERAAVILKAAELLSGPCRDTLNAATMLNMSKSCHQAEIDSACELLDFWRFNSYYMTEIYKEQPASNRQMMNILEHRPLEGFVFAVTPFNFTAIAGNLPTSPMLMGNTVVWKPASSAVLPAYYVMKILEKAGMPPGVINMIPGPGPAVGPVVLNHPDLGGVHFTGSTAVFRDIWKTIGSDIGRYGSYPRIVGETGGKDFIFAHPSADIDVLVTGLIRGAFEFQGQKCSAASRAYIPDSLWPEVKQKMLDEIKTIKVGDVADFSNYMNAVIDKNAFQSISEYIDFARNSSDLEILCGGEYDDSEGYFIQPTVVESDAPQSRLMVEEIFGPVLTVYVYPEMEFDKTLALCDQTSPYALTGAIFAQDRQAVVKAMSVLRHSAGNFYVNDKPTGAVVGQQPFGGSRASGTNDKAGSKMNLERWVTPRAIKETYNPPTNYRYPFLG